MSKKRSSKTEVAEKRPWVVVGNPLVGYGIEHQGDPLPLHFERMWDAIETRDGLLSGEITDEKNWPEQFSTFPPVPEAVA